MTTTLSPSEVEMKIDEEDWMSNDREREGRTDEKQQPTGVSHGHVERGSEGEADLSQTGTTSGGNAGRITDLEDAGRKPDSPLEFDKTKTSR